MDSCCWIWRGQFESDFCRGPQRSSQDFSEPETNFSGKFFKLVDKAQFEALLQTQAAEVGTALEKTALIRNYSLLLNWENFESDFCWLSEPESGHDDKDRQEG